MMKKNVLKAMTALCLCGLMLTNVNVLLAGKVPDDGPQFKRELPSNNTGGVSQCRCAGNFLFGRSCKANGKGKNCAPAKTTQCWDYNENCTR